MNNAANKAKQDRDARNGQYAFDGKLDRMCGCGHTLGLHGQGGSDCMAGTGCMNDPHPGTFCDCEKFHQARRQRTTN